MKILLDTCAILWSVASSQRLSLKARTILQAEETEPFVSAISTAEIACAVDRGRIKLDRHWKSWFRHYMEINQWVCLPVDLAVVEEAYSLPSPFHSDPADRNMVASARIHDLAIVTGDGRILAYPHVDTVW